MNMKKPNPYSDPPKSNTKKINTEKISTEKKSTKKRSNTSAKPSLNHAERDCFQGSFSAGLLQFMQLQQNQYTLLLTHLEQKKSALIGNQPSLLASIDQDILQCHQKIKQLNQIKNSRFKTEQLPETTRLSEVIQHVVAFDTSKAKTDAQTMQYQLHRTAQQAHQMNEEIKVLLTIASKWVHNTVAVVMAAIAPEGQSYKPDGKPIDKQIEGSQAIYRSTVNHSA
ncbi:MAG: flagellar export chaperone FlgN [Cyanobacteria bacterium P01_H01_bin.74]